MPGSAASSNERGEKKKNQCLPHNRAGQPRKVRGYMEKRSFTLITDNKVLECRKHPQEGESRGESGKP